MQIEEITALVEAMPLPCLLITNGERVHAANLRATELWGERLAGRHLMTVMRQPSVISAVERCAITRAPQVADFLQSDGHSEQTLRAHCGPVTLGSLEAVLVNFEDITHLEAAGQMRRDFVANVSHELKTPLTALMGFIETLQGPAREDAKARDRFLGIMADEASRMNRLVYDLLSLSQVEAEARIRPSHSVDLVGVINSTLNRLQPVADKSNVTIEREVPAAHLAVPGDEDQLRQVITNLVENAIKYGGPDQIVEIKLTQKPRDPALRGPAVVMEIIDNGPGIDPVHLPRLTERFYRIDSHRSREMGGTGLGLAIVKHIINRHRGRFKIDSVPGHGATFTVILPALD